MLKGYQEVLQADEEPRTREIAAIMGRHLLRMEAYVNSMSRLRRLEDTQPDYRMFPLQPFLDSLQESAQVICAKEGKSLYVQKNISIPQLCLDAEFIIQVYNNLVSNAARYARTAVTLSFVLENESLRLTVSDDGEGFGEDSLQKVVDPYFTGEKDSTEHFGLGLYICKLLCERHGGCLKVMNLEGGASVSAFFKIPTL